MRKEPVQIHVFCALKFRGKENRVKNNNLFLFISLHSSSKQGGIWEKGTERGGLSSFFLYPSPRLSFPVYAYLFASPLLTALSTLISQMF